MWLSRIGDSSPAFVTLFCVPHAGVGVSAYRNWAEALRPEIEVVSIQLPGRENRLREQAFSSMGQLVPELTSALLAHSPERPFAFFGNSFGALIAFEVVHELERLSGLVPQHLFVSSCAAPESPKSSPIHHLRDAEFVAELLKRYDGIPPAILQDAEFMREVLPTLRADLKLFEEYEYRTRAPLGCPISVFGGRNDRMISPELLAGWRQQTAGAFNLRLFDSGHLYLQTELKALTQDIRAALLPVAKCS